MVLIGKQITAAGDVLQPIEVEIVHRAILNKDGEVAKLQNRLQAIRMMDTNQYRKLKTALPYLVCGHFQPRIRRKENFVFTDRFIVDIDHLSEYEIDMQAIKNKLCADPRVELLFTSPGGDGLKVLFVLKEKITDTGYYAVFYKYFCLKLSEQYQLGASVDTRTNDVSRCCFVSHDATAYFNANAEKIDAGAYLPDESAPKLDFLNAEIREREKENALQKKELGIAPNASAPLTDDILNQIKMKVGMRVKKQIEKEYVQPEELEKIIPEVLQQLAEVGAELQKMTPISYGRQLRITAGPHWAEVNLFYGKRGVSIVGTTKTGSNKQLCESMVTLLKNHFS